MKVAECQRRGLRGGWLVSKERRMAVRLVVADQCSDAAHIREVFWEYLEWANSRLIDDFGVNLDIAALQETDMRDLGKFMLPRGRLLLCYVEDRLAGVACLKQLTPTLGELKRMYVRPEYRRLGLGRMLLHRLIEEARQIGYQGLQLDSARFMHEAHQLYRSVGFREIEAYEGSEIPKQFREHWVFMRLELSEKAESASG